MLRVLVYLSLDRDRLATIAQIATDRGVDIATVTQALTTESNSLIDRAVTAGKIDAAIVWGPIAGYFAKRVTSPALTVVPLRSEPGVKFDYEMAMGVRYGEREWKQQVEGLLESRKAEIGAILKEFGVPIVDESYAAQKP